jgi:hypothetical protein
MQLPLLVSKRMRYRRPNLLEAVCSPPPWAAPAAKTPSPYSPSVSAPSCSCSLPSGPTPRPCPLLHPPQRATVEGLFTHLRQYAPASPSLGCLNVASSPNSCSIISGSFCRVKKAEKTAERSGMRCKSDWVWGAGLLGGGGGDYHSDVAKPHIAPALSVVLRPGGLARLLHTGDHIRLSLH